MGKQAKLLSTVHQHQKYGAWQLECERGRSKYATTNWGRSKYQQLPMMLDVWRVMQNS